MFTQAVVKQLYCRALANLRKNDLMPFKKKSQFSLLCGALGSAGSPWYQEMSRKRVCLDETWTLQSVSCPSVPGRYRKEGSTETIVKHWCISSFRGKRWSENTFRLTSSTKTLLQWRLKESFALDWMKICIQVVLLICTLCKQNQNKMEVQK